MPSHATCGQLLRGLEADPATALRSSDPERRGCSTPAGRKFETAFIQNIPSIVFTAEHA